MFQSLDDPQMAGAILGVRRAGRVAVWNDFTKPRGELAGFNEKKPGAGVINAGVYLFRGPVIGLFRTKRR
jgi:hypothetical protein